MSDFSEKDQNNVKKRQNICSNITAICPNKVPLFTESEMISKNLESSHLSSFSVNPQVFLKLSPNIVGKLSPNIVKNCQLLSSEDPQSCS